MQVEAQFSDQDDTVEVAIIGGGPAGLSALMWCNDLGISSVLFERGSEAGGQLLEIHNLVTNYPGIVAENGRDLLADFLRTMPTDVVIRTGSEVRRLNASDKAVHLSNGERFNARSLILATGVRRRKLGVPGEDEFLGKGIMHSGALERDTVGNEPVVIVGGGDAALENALMLAGRASRVYLVHRSSQLRAREEFQDAEEKDPKIEFIKNSAVEQFIGSDRLNGVEVRDLGSGRSRVIETEKALIRIGVEPNSELLRGQVEMDANGYVMVDVKCSTSASGVFAIGDVANPTSPTVVSAAGMGATAAKAAFELIARR
jgi:thioredoxin reductase (NADPH)